MANHRTRREFLQAAPLAAAASLPLAATIASGSSLGEAPGLKPEPFQVFTAEKIGEAMKTFQTQFGQHYLFQPEALPLTIAMTTQEKTAAKEFEFHEGRDHVFLILEGATKFELGGIPKEPRNTKPGEWLAPASEGATTVEARKGDMLVVPRGTPHRQSTEHGVVWILISSSGIAKS